MCHNYSGQMNDIQDTLSTILKTTLQGFHSSCCEVSVHVSVYTLSNELHEHTQTYLTKNHIGGQNLALSCVFVSSKCSSFERKKKERDLNALIRYSAASAREEMNDCLFNCYLESHYSSSTVDVIFVVVVVTTKKEMDA